VLVAVAISFAAAFLAHRRQQKKKAEAAGG
jgi:hypothetical protein